MITYKTGEEIRIGDEAVCTCGCGAKGVVVQVDTWAALIRDPNSLAESRVRHEYLALIRQGQPESEDLVLTDNEVTVLIKALEFYANGTAHLSVTIGARALRQKLEATRGQD